MGKILVLSFDNNEDDIVDEILNMMTRKRIDVLGDKKQQNFLKFEGLTIKEDKQICVKGNQEIQMTYTEFEILLLLAKNAGSVFSKERIYDLVWKEPHFGDYNIVMSHIRNIREKIEDNPSKPFYIQTVWGVGYRFNKNCLLN